VATHGYHGVMKTVGIKVLKAKLSEIIRMVKAGHTILVTERGEVTLASDAPQSWKGFKNKVRLKGTTSGKILDDLREDCV